MELALVIFGLIILVQTIAIVALVWLHAGKPRLLPASRQPVMNAAIEPASKVAFYHGLGSTVPTGIAPGDPNRGRVRTV